MLIMAGSFFIDYQQNFCTNFFGRSGALISCVGLIFPFLSFNKKAQFDEMEKIVNEIYKNIGKTSRLEKSERNFGNYQKYSSFFLAVIGSIVNGYGDLVKTFFV